MRLHRLAVTAFGPFAGTEEVDFDRLAAGGLFLLRGATGAGKSSVLDAVCYAVYGEVPGARKGNPLRSDHAEPGLLTEVRLDLTLGGRRLEITRSPEQQRPKLRGSGTTTEKARTLLREWVSDTGDGTPGWRGVSRSHQEAGEEVRRLIGMSREQFCQVVLLPQGDFARFLRADTKQRADLLGRLFDTRRFGQVERWLADRRNAREAAVREGRQRLRELAGRAEEAAGPDAEPREAWVPDEDGGATGAGGLVSGLLGWSALLRCDAAERATAAGLALEAARDAQADALRLRDRADDLADRQRRHRDAVELVRRLTDPAADTAGERARLARARSALGTESLLRLRDSHAAAHRAAAADRRERLAELHRLGAPALLAVGTGPADGHPADADRAGLLPHQGGPAGSWARADDLAGAERRLRALGGELTAAREDERRHDRLVAEERESTARQAEAERAAERARGFLDGYDARLAVLHAEREDASLAAALVERIDVRRGELAGRLEAARRRDGLREAVAAGERGLLDLRRTALDAREHALDLERRRLDGMAGELAAQLTDGVPCRVCGAAEHPAPARPAADGVTADDQRRARTAQAAAERAVADADRELTELLVDEASATEAAGGRTVEELAAELAAAAGERAAAVRRAEGIGPVEQRIARLTKEQEAARDQLRESGEATAAASARLRALDGERRGLAARLAAARGDAPSVAARAAQVDGAAGAVAAALAAVRAEEEAAARLADAERELVRAAAEAGFASPREAAGALLPAAERAALEARSKAHDRALAAAEAELARPELVAAAALPPADPAAAAQELARATARLGRAGSAADEAGRRREALARLGDRTAALARELAPALDELGRIGRLSALVSGAPGENALRMRLESYVLAARLEQVAAAASERLVRMSGGRYTLVHSDGPVSGTKRSGLSLRVVDAWTGSDRDTATLSGGEGFFASLALALGLADVVTDEAGGMPLDTLFIDEGFGSLDERTLEEVMDVLDGLRERDRSVGIVSHVADLRSRIPSQLVVRKGRNGSTLVVTAQADV